VSSDCGEGAVVVTAVMDKPFGWPPQVAAILATLQAAQTQGLICKTSESGR
jgi:hypothetical protein